MNTLLFLCGGFVSVEGTMNLLFYKFVKPYCESRSARRLFQLGRSIRVVAGLITVYFSL